MMKITRKTFKAISTEMAAHLEDNVIFKDEFYGTPLTLFKKLLEEIEKSMFREEIEREARYKTYLELKSEFEPHLLTSTNPNIGSVES